MSGGRLERSLDIFGDDTGDNISALNPFYGELTGHYWLWRNETDADIIGICHYRRYFWNAQRKPLTIREYEQLLEDCDVLVTNRITGDITYRTSFGRAHNVKDLDLMGAVIRELYPMDYPAYEEVIGGYDQYYANMYAMRKSLFDEFCAWMFSIFAELGDRVDLAGYDDYHKRLFGFLSENLIMVYAKARGLKLNEGTVGIVAEKAETVEFKLALAQMVKLGRFDEALSLFYEYLKIRPDVELALSDLRGEIPIIEQILMRLAEEKKTGRTGLYEISQDLFALINYVKKHDLAEA